MLRGIKCLFSALVLLRLGEGDAFCQLESAGEKMLLLKIPEVSKVLQSLLQLSTHEEAAFRSRRLAPGLQLSAVKAGVWPRSPQGACRSPTVCFSQNSF